MVRTMLGNVHPTTQLALTEYVKRIAEREKSNLRKIILFGSVARGEATSKSDIDVLIILKNRTMQNRRDICAIAAVIEDEMNYDDNAYLQPITVSEEDVNGIGFFELMSNVEHEGVTLYDYQ